MLYEVLAGRPPFAGETAIEILMKAVKHHLPRPSSVLEAVSGPAFDASIEDICLKAMARFPKDRYASAEDLAQDLTQWLAGKTVKVRLPKQNPLGEESRSYRWIFAAVAALALGLVLPPALPLLRRTPSSTTALEIADQFLAGDRLREALVAYAQVLAVDPSNARAEAGRRETLARLDARAERDRAEALAAKREAEVARQETVEAHRAFKEREAELAREAVEAREAADKARRAAEAAARTEIESFRQAEAREDKNQQAERERLAAERAAAEARALAAEQKARLAQEQLARVQAEPRMPTPPPAVLLPGLAPLKAAPVDPATLQPGLVAEYFSGTDFNAFALRRIDPQINFRWLKQPAWPGGPEDRFSVRWTGYLRAPKTRRYQFEAFSDDGVRLFIDDAVVFSDWTAFYRHRTSGGCNLEEGLHRFRFEYFEYDTDALVALSWVPDDKWEADLIGPEFLLHDPAALAPPPEVKPPAPEGRGF